MGAEAGTTMLKGRWHEHHSRKKLPSPQAALSLPFTQHFQTPDPFITDLVASVRWGCALTDAFLGTHPPAAILAPKARM